MAYNMPVRQGFGSVAFYPVEPDQLDTDPPENTIKKVNAKRGNLLKTRLNSKLGRYSM
jgi:hypothetical protein